MSTMAWWKYQMGASTKQNVKQSNPIELAEYAIANWSTALPDFDMWVPPTIKKRDWFISHLQAQYKKRTHKIGIVVPTSVEHSLEINTRMKMSFQHTTIQK